MKKQQGTRDTLYYLPTLAEAPDGLLGEAEEGGGGGQEKDGAADEGVEGEVEGPQVRGQAGPQKCN